MQESGGVAGIYVNSKHFNRLPGLSGWFSSRKDKQFDMEHTLTVTIMQVLIKLVHRTY